MEATLEAPAATMSKYVANRFGKYDCPFCNLSGANGLPSSAALAQHARHAHGRNNKLSPEQKRELVEANRDAHRPATSTDLGEDTGFGNPLPRMNVQPEANGERHADPRQPMPAPRKPTRMEAAVQIMQLDAVRGMSKAELQAVFTAVQNLADDDAPQGAM